MTDAEIIEPTRERALSPVQKVKGALDKRIPVLAKVLPAGIAPEDFIAVCVQAVMRDDKLERAFQVNPGAVFQAFLDCARDGLIPDGREAHIDARRDKKMGMTAAYMPMARGMVKRLYRSGLVREINLQVVREGDEFTPDLSEGGAIHHIPQSGDGRLTHAYAVVGLVGGGVVRRVMFAEEIGKRRAVSKTSNVWSKWPEEMWKKTVLHNVSKELPLTPADQRMFDALDAFTDLEAEVAPSAGMPTRLDLSGSTLAPVADAAPTAPDGRTDASPHALGYTAAKCGIAALAEFWDSLTEAEQEELAERHDTVWAPLAQQADANAAEVELSNPTQNETDERSAA